MKVKRMNVALDKMDSFYINLFAQLKLSCSIYLYKEKKVNDRYFIYAICYCSYFLSFTFSFFDIISNSFTLYSIKKKRQEKKEKEKSLEVYINSSGVK